MSVIGSPPATVTMALLGGADSAFYSKWKNDVDAAVRDLPGFLESDAYEPIAGLQDRWVLVLRFDGEETLSGWLKSDKRPALLEQAKEWAPIEQVIAGEGSVKKPVTILVQTRVKPDEIEAFKAWQEEMFQQQRSFPGYVGGKLLPPLVGVSDQWTITMRFDSDENVENWLKSPERRSLMEKVDAPLRGDTPRKVTADLGGWFHVTSTEAPPSDWKQALCVLLPLYPLVIILSKLNIPGHVWPATPFALAVFINNVLSMIALTWFIMPHLTKALSGWLAPRAEQPKSKDTTASILLWGVMALEVIVCLLLT